MVKDKIKHHIKPYKKFKKIMDSGSEKEKKELVGEEWSELFKELKEATNWIKERKQRQEILEREVKRYGTGAHIVVPSKHLGKNAKIILFGRK